MVDKEYINIYYLHKKQHISIISQAVLIQQQWDKRWIIFLFYSEHAGNLMLFRIQYSLSTKETEGKFVKANHV